MAVTREKVALASLPDGALFYPPRLTRRFTERWKVWGRGAQGGVYVQEWVLVWVNRRRTYQWGPAQEWAGSVLVERVPTRKRRA